MFGRHEELESLRCWQHSPREVAIRTLVGTPGVGKTRLAAAFVAQVAAEETGPWSAGFVELSEWRHWLARADAGGRFWQRPSLLVVDDAALEVERLRRLLRAIAPRPAGFGPPLRILLVARQADPQQGWLRYLQEEVAVLFDPVEPMTVSALPGRALLENLGHTSDHPFAETAPRSPDRSDQLAPSFSPRDQLWEVADGDADKVAMAGVLATATGTSPTKLLQNSRIGLAFALADLEWDRLVRLAPPEDPEAGGWLVHLAACATVLGGASTEEVAAVADEERMAFRRNQATGTAVLAERLARGFPNLDPSEIRIAHTLVGAAFVLRVLGRRQLGNAGRAVLSRLARRRPAAVATFLVRLADNFGGRCHPEPLEWIGVILDRKEEVDPGWLLEAGRVLAGDVPGIRTLTTHLFGRVLEALQPLVSLVDGSVLAAEFGRLLGELSWRLADLGHREAALAAAQRAEACCRELAQAHPAEHWVDWAGALGVLAYRLSDLGLSDAAVAEARKAQALWEADAVPMKHTARAGSTSRDRARAGWAASLEVTAAVLERAQRFTEAQAAATQAVEAYRQQATHDPGNALPRLAAAQSRLGVLLGACGRVDEALAVLRQAETTCHGCHPSCPDRTSATWAAAMVVLSRKLHRLGSHEDALACAEQALRIWRRLGQDQPAVFLPDFGRGLCQVAAALSEVGRAQEAVVSLAEAEQVYGQLAGVDPGTYLGELVIVKLDRARLLTTLGQWRTALQSVREAEPMLQALAEAQPTRFLALWAKALELEGACYRALPQAAVAIEDYGRAVTTCCARMRTSSTIAGLSSQEVA